MRAFRPSFPFLLAFLIAPALGVFLHSSFSDQRFTLRMAVLMASTESDQELFDRGVDKFDEQLYREAFALFEAVDGTKVDARPLTFYREAAALRLAVMQGEDSARRRAARGLEAVADEAMDDWGARAVAELIRSGMTGDSELSRLLELTLQHWEQSPEVELATEEYATLLMVWLETAQERGGIAPPALRMWENLVRVEAPRADLNRIAGHLLAGRVRGMPIPQHQTWRRTIPPVAGGHDALVQRVAKDVLSWDAEPWLAAAAHWRLGHAAENRGEFRAAAEHYRAAIELADSTDSWASEQSRERLEQLLASSIQLNGPALYRPGSEHVLHLNWRNLDRWSVEVRRVDLDEDLRLPSSRRYSATLSEFLKPGSGTTVVERNHQDEKERTARQSDTAAQPHQFRSQELWLEPLEPGVYLVEVTGTAADSDRASTSARVAFHVTDLGVTFRTVTADDAQGYQLELWLVEMLQGEPLADAKLTLHVGRRQGDRIEWGTRSLRTDENGIAAVSALAWNADASFLTGTVDGRPIVAVNLRTNAPQQYENHYRSFLLTDRPLYRPGETVHFQAFVRERNVLARASTVPDVAEVEWIVTAPDGSEFRRETFTLDENGAFEAHIDLPDKPALGAYAIQLKIPSKDMWVGNGTFQVDEYRLPEFTVAAALDADQRYVLGDTLQVDVTAEYLFGGPVQGSAEIVVTRQPLWIWYRPFTRHAWLYEDKGRPYYWGGQEEVLRLSQPLDADGRLTVAIPTSLQESNPQDYTYTVQARVTDSSRREEQGQTTVKVTRQELYAYLTPTRYLLAPGSEAQVRLRVQDSMGRPAKVAGRWWVERMLEDGKIDELLSRNTRTTDEGEIDLTFDASTPGHYRVHFETQDARGNELTATTTLWCADPSTKTVTHGEGGLQLIAERDEFLDEDTARVLLVSDVAGVPVYLSRHFGGVVETEVLRMEGTVELLEIPISQLHRPYFYVQAVSAHDYLLRQAKARVVAPMAEQALDVTINFDAETHRPGETGTLRVQARDGLGNPVQTPLTVAVVDEAILALLPRQLGDPNETFNRYDTPAPHDLFLGAARFGGYAERKKDGDDVSDDERDVGNLQRHIRGGRSQDASFRVGGLEAEEAMGGVMMKSATMADAAMPLEMPPPSTTISAPAKLRTDFRTTALWRTAIVTDADGTASVEVPLAESLTKWEALAVAVTPDSRAGTSTATTRTRKDVMVRLNHPRVFRERDRFLFAATVHNETDEDLVATVSLLAEPLRVSRPEQSLTVPAHGQAQVEWWAQVPAETSSLEFRKDEETGRISILTEPLTVRVEALTAVDSDAFERKVKLLAHGTDLRVVAAMEAASGANTLEFTLPRDRLTTAETAVLTLSPSVLSACIDALPFLADYPYGCTEQTLSRFVPAVAVRSAVEALGVSSRRIDPELDDKIEKGLRRIVDFQHGDGGWGWWKQDESRATMTAYVLVALSEAKAAGVRVDHGMLQRGREALRKFLPHLEPRPDDMAYALYALSCADAALSDPAEDETMTRYAKVLFDGRDDLRDYARALLATYLHRNDHAEDARLVLEHLDNTAQRDDKYDTVHWGKQRNYWWRGEGAVETTAFALMAIGEIDPAHRYFRAAARWLVLNREGNRWSNTRATAHAIFSLVDFAREAGELDANYTIVASIDGQEIAKLVVDRESLIDGGGQFLVSPELLSDGRNRVRLDLDGEGVCYASLAVETYTQQENPEPTEYFLGVRREIVRLRSQRTLGGAILQMEEPLADGATVASGDRLRVRLHLTAHNDLEYLAIEDPRPAGAEPVDRLSGWFWGNGLSGRREVRDELTGFFVGSLPQGEHVLEYELRAESPGTFHVMPTRAYAMYVPDVNGSSAEDLVEIAVPEGSEAEWGR